MYLVLPDLKVSDLPFPGVPGSSISQGTWTYHQREYIGRLPLGRLALPSCNIPGLPVHGPFNRTLFLCHDVPPMYRCIWSLRITLLGFLSTDAYHAIRYPALPLPTFPGFFPLRNVPGPPQRRPHRTPIPYRCRYIRLGVHGPTRAFLVPPRPIVPTYSPVRTARVSTLYSPFRGTGVPIAPSCLCTVQVLAHYKGP